MRKLLVDTNVVLDLLGKREPFYEDAAILFSLADMKKVKVSVSSLTFATTYYIVRKHNIGTLAKEILRKLRLLTDVLSLDAQIIDLALNDSSFRDFEDALQYYSATENSLDIIITRNLKDFKSSKLPVMTAGEFVKTMQ